MVSYICLSVYVSISCQSTSKEKYVVLMIIFFLRVMSKKFLREIGRQMSRKRRRQLGSLYSARVASSSSSRPKRAQYSLAVSNAYNCRLCVYIRIMDFRHEPGNLKTIIQMIEAALLWPARFSPP